jgi:hypothetical protein
VPHIIHPDALYFLDEAKRLMRWRSSTARREIRAGRLKVAKRGGRYYLLGRWLLAWIEGGLVRPRQQPAADACACGREERP